MELIGSGTVILAEGERLSVPVGDYIVTFVDDDSAPTRGKEIMVVVPHGYALGRISTTNDGSTDGVDKVVLRVMFMPGGARGELVQASYSLLRLEG